MSGADDAPGAAVAGLDDRPVLVVDPGVHTAAIRRLDVDRAGRFLVTASADKTIRVWAAKDGKLVRTIRLPAGPRNVGKPNAVAISPDGATIAAGGITRLGDHDVYLFDRVSGRLLRRVRGLPGAVAQLTYSPDGTQLAATLGGGWGVRLIDSTTDRVVAPKLEWPPYTDSSFGATFDPISGRLATTSWDGKVRLYGGDDMRLLQVVNAPAGRRPFDIAFSPDGSQLAVGYDDTTAVTVLDGTTLALLFAADNADTVGIDDGDFSKVAWSADGSTLLAAGKWRNAGGERLLRRWPEGGRGAPEDWPLSLNTVMSLRPLPGGRLAFAAADPRLGVLNPGGHQAWGIGPSTNDLRYQQDILAVSIDGGRIAFRIDRWDNDKCVWDRQPMRFSLPDLRLAKAEATEQDLATARTTAPGLVVEDWRNSYRPTLNGNWLPLDSHDAARSLAVARDGQRFVLGTEWSLRLFDRTGTALWRQPVPGPARAVNVSGDGRLIIAAYGDGTIRWHKLDDGTELLAFFLLADDERWVVWTPEGYYASSPGTGSVLGWHVNRGWDQAADFYPITAYAGFYQPKTLPLVLQELETARALGIAKIAQDRMLVQEAVKSVAPPGPQLHVLAVGISEYANHERLRLDFAAADARDIANALLAQEGGLYAKVNPKYLLNSEATRKDFFVALKWLHERMQPGQNDAAVILFSGHGAEAGGTYYLMPHDVEANDRVDVMVSGIQIDEFKRLLAGLGERGKVLVLLDACHSGNVLSGAKEGLPPDIEVVREELAKAGTGVIVLTSSTGQEVSKEHPDWQNGAFTEAVLEALAGKADSDGDQYLGIGELEAYVVKRVRELTNSQQNPQIAVIGEHHFVARLFRVV